MKNALPKECIFLYLYVMVGFVELLHRLPPDHETLIFRFPQLNFVSFKV